MLTRYQQKKLSDFRIALRKDSKLPKKDRRAKCPVCYKEMDSAYVNSSGSEFLGWFCLKECKAGSEDKC